jgi:hypothetical protein
MLVERVFSENFYLGAYFTGSVQTRMVLAPVVLLGVIDGLSGGRPAAWIGPQGRHRRR